MTIAFLFSLTQPSVVPAVNIFSILPGVVGVIVGAVLTFYFGRTNHNRQVRLELHIQRYREGTAFIESLSRAIDKRCFLSQRFIWALETNDSAKIAKAEEEYMNEHMEWNINRGANWNKIRLLIGAQFAKEFLDYGDDNVDISESSSLHYHFIRVHRYIRAVQNGTLDIQTASTEVVALSWHCWYFLEKITTEFATRASQLELLTVPSSHQSTHLSARSTRSTGLRRLIFSPRDVLRKLQFNKLPKDVPQLPESSQADPN